MDDKTNNPTDPAPITDGSSSDAPITEPAAPSSDATTPQPFDDVSPSSNTTYELPSTDDPTPPAPTENITSDLPPQAEPTPDSGPTSDPMPEDMGPSTAQSASDTTNPPTDSKVDFSMPPTDTVKTPADLPVLTEAVTESSPGLVTPSQPVTPVAEPAEGSHISSPVESPMVGMDPVAPVPTIASPHHGAAHHATPQSSVKPEHPGSKKHSKVVPIIVAAIVILVLLAVAGYAYSQTKKTNDAVSKTTTKTADAPAKTQPATADDVVVASQALDSELSKVNDDKDYMATDLSDSTLNL